VILDKKEYGELCHAIWTINAGKIPELGYLLYKEHFYVYTYDVEECLINCINKLLIDGNEARIAAYLKEIG